MSTGFRDGSDVGSGETREIARVELELEAATAGTDIDRLVVQGGDIEGRGQASPQSQGRDATEHVARGPLGQWPLRHRRSLGERLQIELGRRRDDRDAESTTRVDDERLEDTDGLDPEPVRHLQTEGRARRVVPV